MAPDIQIDAAFVGPDLLELQPILADIPDPIEARWEGTPGEFDILRGLRDRKVILYVRDHYAFDKLTLALGGKINLSPDLIHKGKDALIKESAVGWRELCESQGHARSTLLLVKLVADGIRAGNRPVTTPIAISALLKGVNPADVDVILKVRSRALRS